MLDLWPYKAGLKERVGAIEKELQAPAAKLAIGAAIGAGRHTVVKLLSALMDLVVVELPRLKISMRRCMGSSSSRAMPGLSTP